MTDALDSKIRAFLVELVDAAPSPPEFDAIEQTRPTAGTSTTPVRRRSATRRLVPALIATVVVIGAGAAVVATRDNDPAILAGQATPQEVGVDAISAADASLIVWMDIGASDAQVAAVHDAIASSPEVQQFATLDREDSYRDFAQIFACRPELVQSIAAKDLPESFRLIGMAQQPLESLRLTLTLMPGVDLVEAGQPDQACDPTASDSGDSASPATLTLPYPVGPEPADPAAARAAVISAFTQAFTGTNSAEQRRAAVQDGTDLAAALDEARTRYPESVDSMSIEINDLRLLDATRAAVIYTVTMNGAPIPQAVGYAVLDGDQWKVSRNTMCKALILATVDCPA
jgi:FtsX extracellular domain